MKVNINIANKANFGGSRDVSSIKYIVIHYTGNDGDRAGNNANYFKNNIVKASAHYFVDDDSVWQSVPDNFTAWSVGGNRYPSCGATGGGRFYGKCTNNNSISVELCDTVKNGKSDFTEKTINTAVELVRSLMIKFDIPIENVIRHFDVVGKTCPKPFVESKAAWADFKERLVEVEMVEKGKIIVNGKEVEVDLIFKDGTNYVKLRDLAKALDLKVTSKGKMAVIG